MIQLPTVTLISIATRDVDSTARAMEYSCQGITFGDWVMVSPYRPDSLPEYMRWVHIDPFPSIDDWNKEVFYNLWKYFDTEHCLLVHNDGFVVHPESWKDEWLELDYIGSPWDIDTSIAIQGGRDQELSRVGNSVGLRSRKLSMLPTQLNIPWVKFNQTPWYAGDYNEDTMLSCHYWKEFSAAGCKKGTLEQAIEFGREAEIPENQHVEKPFCFHKWYGRNHIYPRF